MWQELTESELAASLSQREIDAFRRDASLDGADPVPALLKRTAAKVRIFVSSSSSTRLGPLNTVPPSLVSVACDIAAYDLLHRLNVPVSEDRRKANDRAYEILEKIANGALKVESGDEESDEADAAVATTPAFAPATPSRLLD